MVTLESKFIEEQNHLKQRIDAINKDEATLDTASDGVEKENRAVLKVLRSNALKRLNNVNRAYQRLVTGVYGRCEKCYEPISPARLEAAPYSKHCLSCSDTSNRH